MGESVRESKSEDETPQLAIETQNDIQPGVIYDTALENTFSKMKKQKRFFKKDEIAIGDIFWNGIPIEK